MSEDKTQNAAAGGRLKLIVSRFLCWWFGCDADHDNAQSWHDYDHWEYHVPCKRCDCKDVSYGDQVGDTRHNRFKNWCNYWLFRKWWPAKCSSCGHRFKCDDSIDHIPF